MNTCLIEKPASAVGQVLSRGARIFHDWRLLFGGIVALAAILRLYQLSAESLWIDEGFSLRDTGVNPDPVKGSKPLYYGFLTLWVQLGDSDWWLRLPAVIFGIASVALIFLIGRMIWNTRVGALAALMAAVSPMQVDHSQEVRMYSLLMLTVLGSACFLILALRTWKFRYMLASSLCLWLAVLTHPLALFVIVPENLAVLEAYLRNRRPLLPWIAAQIIFLVAWLPWLPVVLGFGNYMNDSSWLIIQEKPTLSDIPKLLSRFALGPWNPVFASKSLMVYTYGALVLLLSAIWLERRKPEARFVAGWLVIPIFTLLFYSIFRSNSWVTRYLIYVSPAFFLLLAVVWARQNNKLVFALMGILLFIVPAGKLVRYYQKTMRPEWKQAVQYVMERDKPDDVIAVYRFGNQWVLRHYYNGPGEIVPLGSKHFQKGDIMWWNEVKAVKWIESIPDAPRKWMIVAKVPEAADRSFKAAMEKHYKVISSRQFDGVLVFLFEGNTTK